jgi:flagellar hook-associated protein 3 FlgL
MRVPDSLLQNNFIFNLNRSRRNLADIQTQLATQSKVNKPSDNPLSNSRIMRMQDQLSTIYTYKSNISYAKSVINDAIISMEAMHDEMQNVQVKLTELNSGAVGDNLQTFADSVGASLDILLELANTEFNGQYNFAGTENNSKPFYYDEVNNRVVANSDHLGGDRTVKISSGITQKFNVTGKELFQSVFTQNGNLDSTAAIGSNQTDISKIYDAEGNEYTLNLTYTKTAENTYELNYSILDSDSNEIENQTVSDLTFNSETGKFQSMDGEPFGEIQIQNADNKIDFVIDVSSLSESDSASKLNGRLNQKADIFNTLISIREKLLNGEKPSADQVEMVNEFSQYLLDKTSMAGGISIKLKATEDILFNREIETLELLSLEKDVDMERAIIDLQMAQYTLDVSYHISSMILPKSLLDYL